MRFLQNLVSYWLNRALTDTLANSRGFQVRFSAPTPPSPHLAVPARVPEDFATPITLTLSFSLLLSLHPPRPPISALDVRTIHSGSRYGWTSS